MLTSRRSPLPSAFTTGRFAPAAIAPAVASSRGDCPPTSTGVSPKSALSASASCAHRSGNQSFCGLLLPITSGTIGRSNGFMNSFCHARSPCHGPSPHDTGSDRHAERREELEILILHMLDRVRRDLPVREEPVEIVRARAVESDLDARRRERG